jgi:hypothetical protein
MPNGKRYLLDSDVLIGAKNIYYRPSFCQGFWDWVQLGHTAGRFFSIDKVKNELLNGKKTDVLYAWAHRPELDDFFLPSTASASKWAELSRWAIAGDFLQGALDKFLDAESADAWLIAYAAQQGDCTVVTNEVPNPLSRKSIKLPDAARVLNVETISLFDLLQRHGHRTFEFLSS